MADTSSNVTKFDQKENIKQIEGKVEDVRLLQIRMPIVASMKAGKSTITNALIGSECLPTRTDAMTALPTAIILKLGNPANEENEQVRWVLEEETSKELRQLQAYVAEILRSSDFDDEKLKKSLLKNVNLLETAKNISAGQQVMFNASNSVTDHQTIKKTLTLINDLVRISLYIRRDYPAANFPLQTFLNNIPQIHVNYRSIGEDQKTDRDKCQMLLIDTPGPNEAATIDELSAFVNNELKKADAILFVVEYGHLNTESDAKIIEYIMNMRRFQKDQENIFILINKIDLLKQNHMSVEDLHSYVAETLKVSKDRVFGLSGYHALIAQRFLTDYRDQRENLVLQNSSTSKDILEAFYPRHWRTMLEKWTLKEAESMAIELHDTSGINNVVNKVLKTVLRQVVKRCIQSCIDLYDATSDNLMNHIKMRLNGLKELEEKLLEEIKELNDDLESLGPIEKTQLSNIKTITSSLRKKLDLIFKQELDEYTSGMRDIFDVPKQQWIELEEQLQKEREELDEKVIFTVKCATGITGFAGGTLIAGGSIHSTFGAFMGGLLMTAAGTGVSDYFRGTHSDNEGRLENDEKAKEYIDSFMKLIDELSKQICKSIENEVNTALQYSCEEFHSELRGQTTIIINRANERLNKTFQTDLSMEKFELELKKIHIKPVDIGYIHNPNSLSWIRRFFSDKPANEKQTWILSRSTLKAKCVQSLEESVKKTQNDMIKQLMTVMEEKLNSFFRKLKDHLTHYRNYAQLCMLDKRRTQENQKIFKDKLIELRNSLEKVDKGFTEFKRTLPWNSSD